MISGTPSQSGFFDFVVHITDAAGRGTDRGYSIKIGPSLHERDRLLKQFMLQRKHSLFGQCAINRVFVPCMLCVMLLPQLVRATDAFYINNGTVTFPPQIDATNFINNGTFDIFTTIPFDTSNTQNFTNNGSMFGTVGFRFDNAPSISGLRKFAANFENRLTGTIAAQDSEVLLIGTNGNSSTGQILGPSYLFVYSTNVVNQGTLEAGAEGLLRLVGTNVDLSRSGIEISPIPAVGSFNGFNTNFFIPDVAIYDYYWGQSNEVSDSSSIISGNSVASPPTPVQGAFLPLQVIRLPNPVGAYYTNTTAFTNISVTNISGMTSMTNLPLTNIIQAVFVGLPAGNSVDWGVRFFNSTDFQNPFKTVTVKVSVSSTNLVFFTPDVASLYLVDTLASETNRLFYTNATARGQRPQNYRLQRLEPQQYANGFTSPNAVPPIPPDLLYKADYTNRIVTNEFATYAAFVDNIASRPPAIPAGTVTNLPGRVEIRADSLDISRTRFRAEGLLDIQTRHLVSSTNTVVDCENLSYTLGSTNGNLKIQNLAKDSVARLKGYCYVWSGLWTNQEVMVIPNYDTNRTLVPITNTVEVRIYAMIFDGSQLLTQLPVTVNTLITHSTDVVINDNMTVVQSLLIDGESLTINGNLTLSSTFFIDTSGNLVTVSLDDWLGTNAPNLRLFTNNGTITIPSEAHFGDDLPTPYLAFVNNGLISAFGQTIKSVYCRITGQNSASGEIALTAQAASFEGGSLSAGGDVRLFGNDIKFTQSTIQTGSRLDLVVTNSLSDAGGSSGNSFSCSDGFRLLIKPSTGDLLGTSINTIAPPFAEVDHVWAANDLGPNAAGFQNNTALGRLVLTPGNFESLFPPLFFFAGTGGNNAIYVDLLDLSNLADYQNEIQINSDLVIYFAAANLSFTPPPTNGVPQQPEEFLDGQFNGHLRWVRGFSGPNSSVPVVINGTSVLVNRGLRNSLIIDSDGDGIPNGLDPYPFDTPMLTKLQLAKQPQLTAVLSWNAIAGKVH